MGFELGSVLMKLGMVSTSDHSSVVSMNLFVALLCACIVLGHLLEEHRWMNESITALAIVSFVYFVRGAPMYIIVPCSLQRIDSKLCVD